MPEISDELLDLIIDKLNQTTDAGPPGEGWASNELDALREKLESLVKVAQRHTVWVNIYPSEQYEAEPLIGIVYGSKNFADINGTSKRIACIEVTFTDGEGLE